MVSTRRSIANANRVLADTKKPEVIEPPDGISNVKKRSRRKAKDTLNAQKSPIIPSVSTVSGNISEHDINPVFSTADGVSKTSSAETLGAKNIPISLPDQNLSDIQRQVPKPLSGMTGSCQDPIIVNENSSPPRPTVQRAKRKHIDERPTEPRRFIAQRYRHMYNYAASKPASTSLPPKRSMQNSHQSHGIYKAINERKATDKYRSQNAFKETLAPTFPVQAQYPLSAQTLAYHVHPNFPPSYTQYYQYPIPLVQHYTITSQSEDMLRKEAAGYVRELSRKSPHTETPSNTDLREMKSGEAEQRNSHHGFSKNGLRQILSDNSLSSPQINIYTRCEQTVPQDLQPNLSIYSLTKHTSLLASLLQIYPYSKDQKGLLEDIRALTSIQSQHMTTWLNSMSQGSCKREDRSSDIDSDEQSRPTGVLSITALNEKDTELRQVFAASAAMWQDGTGHGVADVFGTRPSFTPMPSEVTTATSPNQRSPNSIQRGEETDDRMNIHVTLTPTKQAQEAETRLVRTTISPTPSSRYSPIEKTCDSVPRE